jgi:hypothetical protein
MKQFVRVAARAALVIIMAVMSLWAAAAVFYSNLPWQPLRSAMAVLVVLLVCGILAAVRPFRKAVVLFFTMFAAILCWWLMIPPSNDRDWQPDVAALASATIDGDRLTIHNIRNCDYRTETDYTVAYYDKTYDMSKLKGADLFICYWGSPLIAHTIMSFCFEDDQYLCISIETRKEKSESYSAVKGFFKQFELIYVVGDERDLVRLRTNFRKETVYLYRLTADRQLVREVLLDYMRSINKLKDRAEWYNALTDNCTTAIRGHASPYTHGRMSWKILANGYLDTLLYERKAISTDVPFEQMKALSLIGDKALKVGNSQGYSTAIREGLPNPHP